MRRRSAHMSLDDVAAEHARAPVVGHQQRREDAEQRRLAAAVRTDEAEQLARRAIANDSPVERDRLRRTASPAPRPRPRRRRTPRSFRRLAADELHVDRHADLQQRRCGCRRGS